MIYQPAPLSDFISRWPMLLREFRGISLLRAREESSGSGAGAGEGVLRVVQAALSHREAAAADTAAQVVPHLLQLSDPLLEQLIAELQQVRDNLSSCVGCGCLSMTQCRLYNPQDTLSSTGPGPRRLFPGPQETDPAELP